MQTGRILADIKKQTTTVQQLQISFCLRQAPLDGLCYSKTYLLQSASAAGFLILSNPATLHCNSPFLLVKYFMQTYQPLGSQEIVALTEVNLLPESCEEQSLGSKQ